MNYKIRIPILFLLLTFSISSYADDEKYIPATLTKDEYEGVKSSIKYKLLDPESIIVRRDGINFKRGTTVYACWMVSAKNSFGGYTEPKFAYIAYFPELGYESSSIAFDTVAHQMCEEMISKQ